MTGAFFIAVAAVAVLAVWLDSTESHGRRGWVVAARPVALGTRLSAGDLATESIALPAGGVGALAFTSPGPLLGRVLAAPLTSGELVQSGDLAPAGTIDDLRPVTVAVTASDLDDLADGSLVDVLVTNGSDPSSPTVVVATGARVLSEAQGGSSVVPDGTGADITLGVASLAQVTAVVHAAHTGTLSVVAGAPGDRVTPPTNAAGGSANVNGAGSGAGSSSSSSGVGSSGGAGGG